MLNNKYYKQIKNSLLNNSNITLKAFEENIKNNQI